ncbi:cell wall hydrolase [Patescibacteria group bacterium AH-259-L07]|nr:cell wall hydrolase [Patescibacteria group bacterium AH-259-L07]
MGFFKKLNVIFNKRLIYQDKTKRTIYNQEKVRFFSPSGYYLVVITARAKSEKQLGEYVTDDEDLTVKIDNKTFPKLKSKDLIDSPAAFSGGKLHNLAKTVYFLTFLHGKEHTITLLADKPTNTATFESLEIYRLQELTRKLKLSPHIQAEDGDRRPWITFVLDNLPLRSLKATITYSKRKHDSDDVKVKIDGKIQTSSLSGIKHFFWKFIGSHLSWEFPTKTRTKRFWPWVPQGLHYIEFDADRMPILHKIVINFGRKPSIPEQISPKQIPTVDNPKWTGDFRDDTEHMLLARAIFGEARSEVLSDNTRIAIGWSIRNRVDNPGWWGDSYHSVILEPKQYSTFRISDPNRPFVENPLRADNFIDKKAWQNCYKIAGQVIRGEVQDPTNGANHYYDESIARPKWLTQENFIIKLDTIFFHRL